MATLVLGTVGRVFGGPLGGIIGTAVGSYVDRGILGGGGGSDAGRMSNLAVQSAAYGEAIPVLTGRIRAAGNLIWTAGIVESAGSGGKRNGASTSAYMYTASFAVGLAAREISGLGRIWADGRLIRGADGVFLAPTVMRLHVGSESQQVDPLIAAAEGEAGTPAYRGLAYAVFEDLPLVDFGNRIPNLTFEVIADEGGLTDIGATISALATVDGRPVATVSGTFPTVAGHFAGSGGSIADALSALIDIGGGAVISGQGIEIVGGAAVPSMIEVDGSQARAPGEARSRQRQRRLGGETRLDVVELGYFDVDRDYQPGLQRARRAATSAMERRAIPAAMEAGQAKSLAHSVLARAQAGRLRSSVRLSWRHLGVQPGAHIRLSDEDVVWRVREARFEAFVLNLDLQRVEAAAAIGAVADAGRALAFDDQPGGASAVHLIDLPLYTGGLVTGSRLWVAAAGAAPGWRRTGIEISTDSGASYRFAGVVEGGSVMGAVTAALAAGPVDGWDRSGTVEVELLSERMWLESRSELSVLTGANVALIGEELVQFAMAEALGARRFRLSGLLRGRMGTQERVVGHILGEKFVLIDAAAMLSVEVPDITPRSHLRARATGAWDGGGEPAMAAVFGRALGRDHLPCGLPDRTCFLA